VVKAQSWIFSVRYRTADERSLRRTAVVGPAAASTVEAALHLAELPEEVRAEIRGDETVRNFVDGRLDPDESGHYAPCPVATASAWIVCIGSVHEVLR
jgi:hypothetical protein